MTEKMFGSDPARDDTIQDQRAELQRLQTEITEVQAETAATVEALVLTQANTILGESELAALRADIQTKRQKLMMTQIGVVLRKIEER